MLKNVSEVTLVTKNIFFLKILNFVQSFVECKVSLADGIQFIIAGTGCGLQDRVASSAAQLEETRVNSAAISDYDGTG
jgi:hypothetical protein